MLVRRLGCYGERRLRHPIRAAQRDFATYHLILRLNVAAARWLPELSWKWTSAGDFKVMDVGLPALTSNGYNTPV